MKRHVTCFVEKAGFEPRTLGTSAERYDHCATRPVNRDYNRSTTGTTIDAIRVGRGGRAGAGRGGPGWAGAGERAGAGAGAGAGLGLAFLPRSGAATGSGPDTILAKPALYS
jgi:hypothetical protein